MKTTTKEHEFKGVKLVSADGPRALAEIEADLEEKAEELRLLQEDRDTLPAQIRAATEALDVDRLEEIQRRVKFLNVRIDVLTVQTCQLRVERWRLQLPEAEAAARAAGERYAKKHAEYLRVHEETNRIGVEFDNAKAHVSSIEGGIHGHEKQIAEISRRLPGRLRGALVS